MAIEDMQVRPRGGEGPTDASRAHLALKGTSIPDLNVRQDLPCALRCFGQNLYF